MAAGGGLPLPPVSPRASRERHPPALFKLSGGHFAAFEAAAREAEERWVRVRSASAAIRGAGAAGARARVGGKSRDSIESCPLAERLRRGAGPRGRGWGGLAEPRPGLSSGVGCVVAAGEALLGSGAGRVSPGCGNAVGAHVQPVCHGAHPCALPAAELGGREGGGRCVQRLSA